MKQCRKCKEIKELGEFCRNKRNKDGSSHMCKECCCKYKEKYYNINKEKIAVKGKKHRKERKILKELQKRLPLGLKRCTKCNEIKKLSNFHKDKTRKDGFYSQCKQCKEQYFVDSNQRARYWNKNKDQIKKQCRKYREENKKAIAGRKQKYREENKDKVAESLNKWYKKNKTRVIANVVAYRKWRNKTDPVFKLNGKIRALIGASFRYKSFKKTSKTAKILGCDFNFFYYHMLWSFVKNYNRLPNKNDKLNIDHIVPLATAKTEQGVIKLNHYGNLQWLLEVHNLEKRDRLDYRVNAGGSYLS